MNRHLSAARAAGELDGRRRRGASDGPSLTPDVRTAPSSHRGGADPGPTGNGVVIDATTPERRRKPAVTRAPLTLP